MQVKFSSPSVSPDEAFAYSVVLLAFVSDLWWLIPVAIVYRILSSSVSFRRVVTVYTPPKALNGQDDFTARADRVRSLPPVMKVNYDFPLVLGGLAVDYTKAYCNPVKVTLNGQSEIMSLLDFYTSMGAFDTPVEGVWYWTGGGEEPPMYRLDAIFKTSEGDSYDVKFQENLAEQFMEEKLNED